MEELTWNDVHEIALRLYDEYPDTSPLDIRYTDLHALITDLDGFNDDPMGSNEGILESIQMAWLDEYEP